MQHFVGNLLIELDGDVAYTELYLHADHKSKPNHKWGGLHVKLWVRYVDRFERRNGEWKIAERRLLVEFQREDTAGGWRDVLADQLGRRDDGKDFALTHERI